MPSSARTPITPTSRILARTSSVWTSCTLAKLEILVAAFGGWDAAGAKSFGYPTYWVNRFNQPVEELGVRADGTSTDLQGLLDFVLSGRPRAGR